MHSEAAAIRSYFERDLALLLRESGREFHRQGTIIFVVHGAGAWEIRLGADASVREAEDLTADAIVWLTPESFLTLAQGELPERGIAVDGDRSLVRSLGHWMLPPVNGSIALRAR